MIRELVIESRKKITEKVEEILLRADKSTLECGTGQFFSLSSTSIDKSFRLRTLVFVNGVDKINSTLKVLMPIGNLENINPKDKVNVFGPLGKSIELTKLKNAKNPIVVVDEISINIVSFILEKEQVSTAKFFVLSPSKQNLILPKLKESFWLKIFEDENQLLGSLRDLKNTKQIETFFVATNTKLTKKVIEELSTIEGYVSLRACLSKVCGTRGCYGCIIHSKIEKNYRDSFIRVCEEGPIFESRKLMDFDF